VLMCNGVADNLLCPTLACAASGTRILCPAKCGACPDGTTTLPVTSSNNADAQGSSSLLVIVFAAVAGALLFVLVGFCIVKRNSKKDTNAILSGDYVTNAAFTAPRASVNPRYYAEPMYDSQQHTDNNSQYDLAPNVEADTSYLDVASTDTTTATTNSQPAKTDYYVEQLLTTEGLYDVVADVNDDVDNLEV